MQWANSAVTGAREVADKCKRGLKDAKVWVEGVCLRGCGVRGGGVRGCGVRGGVRL